MKNKKESGVNMQLIELKIYVEIDENQTSAGEVRRHLDTEIDDIISGVVKRVDLIDVIER